MKGFKNVNAYIYGKGIIKTNVGFENGIITHVGNDDVITEEIACEGDLVLLPGFISNIFTVRQVQTLWTVALMH